jgi:xylose isomerase
MTKLPWKISVGLWFIESRGGDRFTAQFKEGISVLERIELAGRMRGVSGIELHYPYEVTEDTFETVRKAARNNGLKILTVIPGLFNEMRFKNGALVSLDKRVRNEAIERIKTCFRMNNELKKNGEGGEFAIYWPAADGPTYSFSMNHPVQRAMIRDGLIECLQSVPGSVLVVEHKPADPACKTYFGTTGEAILLCRDVRDAIGDAKSERIGINPEMAHLLMANADLGYDVSYIAAEGFLKHTHWNTCKRLGADTDMIVGSDNWTESMEVFFWLEQLKYDRWLGLDLMPKNEDTARAVDLSIQAMERMYAEMMSVKDELMMNINAGRDATYNLELLFKARGAKYSPLA